MEEIIKLNNYIQTFNERLLSLIKERINKVDYPNNDLKAIVFDNPLIIDAINFSDDDTFYDKEFIHELKYTESSKKICYRYKNPRHSEHMYNEILSIDDDNDIILLHKIAKHLETTGIKDGHITRYDKPSEIIEIGYNKG